MDINANWYGALVILHNGKRVGWKAAIGEDMAKHAANSRYYSDFAPGECFRQTARFATMAEAERWAASFPAHQHEMGRPPR